MRALECEMAETATKCRWLGERICTLAWVFLGWMRGCCDPVALDLGDVLK